MESYGIQDILPILWGVCLALFTLSVCFIGGAEFGGWVISIVLTVVTLFILVRKIKLSKTKVELENIRELQINDKLLMYPMVGRRIVPPIVQIVIGILAIRAIVPDVNFSFRDIFSLAIFTYDMPVGIMFFLLILIIRGVYNLLKRASLRSKMTILRRQVDSKGEPYTSTAVPYALGQSFKLKDLHIKKVDKSENKFIIEVNSTAYIIEANCLYVSKILNKNISQS